MPSEPGQALRVGLISLHTSPLADAGSGDAGGMNIVVRHAAQELARAGHRVAIFTRRTDRHVPDRQELPGGAVVHHLPAGPAQPADKEEHERLIEPFARALAQHEAWAQVQVAHSHHWFSGVAAQPLAAARGVPHVQSYHSIAAPPGSPLSEGERPEGPGRLDGERRLAALSEAVLAISQVEASTARTRLGAPPERVHVVPPGVDAEMFRPQPGGTSAEPTSAEPTLVVAARLEPLKGIDLAIRALAAVPAERHPLLQILGAPAAAHPGYDAQLRSLAEDLGVEHRVTFTGAVSRQQLAQRFAAAAAVLVPSHSETYGLTALEAAACGVPVIASGAGGLAEAVHDGVTGRIVTDREPDVWARAIEDVLDGATAAEMGRAGRELAEQRTWAQTAAGWVEVYRALLP